MEPQNELQDSGTYIEMDAWITDYLKSASKWAKFLCISGFILIGFALIANIVVINYTMNQYELNNIPYSAYMYVLTIVGMFVFLLYIIPLYYLLRFSSRIKIAMNEQSQEKMEEAFVFLRSHYRFVGILFVFNWLLTAVVLPLIAKAIQS